MDLPTAFAGRPVLCFEAKGFCFRKVFHQDIDDRFKGSGVDFLDAGGLGGAVGSDYVVKGAAPGSLSNVEGLCLGLTRVLERVDVVESGRHWTSFELRTSRTPNCISQVSAVERTGSMCGDGH